MRTAESQPTLIALGLPDYVDYEDLAEMFDDFAVKRIFLSDEDQSSQWAKFEFYSFDEAEKAYALTHLRTIPFIHDSWSLSLSIPWKPRLAGYPRFVKCLPEHTTELQLYEMLHPFGSMAYVRIFKDIGPVVEFWNDEDAMKAEVAVKRHFAGGLKITLQAYDPCVVFCINLNPGVDEESLILYSQQYGRVESARVLKRDGKSRGLGLVRFSSAEEAKYAKASLHGTTWQDKVILARYHEPKNSMNTMRDSIIDSPGSVVLYNSPRKSDYPKRPTPTPTPVPPRRGGSANPPVPLSYSQFQYYMEQIRNNDGLNLHGIPKTDEQDQVDQTSELEEMRGQVSMLEQQNAMLERQIQDERKQMELLQERTTASVQEAEKDCNAWYEQCQTYKRELDLNTRTNKADIEDLQGQVQMLKRHNKELERHLQDENERVELLEKQATNLVRQRDRARQECEEWQRQFLVVESRCKLLEIEVNEAKRKTGTKTKDNADGAQKPDRRSEVEESARKMRELLEEEQRLASEEKRRREREEAARKARNETEEKERARKAQREKEEKERARQEAWKKATELEQERCDKRDSRLRGSGGFWTDKLALERFLLVSDEFERIKFSESKPLTSGRIPWPICNKRAYLSPGEIHWKEVETFFSYVRSTYPVLEYNKLVERTHRLFHPDRWQSRRILESVQDLELRRSLELAGNKVAQAMTPLWRKTKGYDDSVD